MRWGRWGTVATGWRVAATIRACDAAGVQPSAVVVHVVAEQESLTDDTAVQLDGESAPGPTAAELRQMTIREALSPRPEEMIARFAATAPAVIIGGGMLPAPLLAATLAHTASIVPIIHPGDSRAGAALHPVGGVGDVRALPRSDVPVPRLRRPRRRLRCRPHHPVSGGADAGGESEMFVPKTPPAQNILGLARPPTPRWHGGVDLTARAELHHPSGQSAVVPAPVPAHRGGHRTRAYRATPRAAKPPVAG